MSATDSSCEGSIPAQSSLAAGALRRIRAEPLIASTLTIVVLAWLQSVSWETGYHGDTAKFQTGGHRLGTPHEPGYPLYTVVSFVVSHVVPFGSVALRVNLLSVCFGIVVLVLLVRCCDALGLSGVAAGAAVLSAGLGFAFWSQATVAEVYTIDAALHMGVLLGLLTLPKAESPPRRLLWLVAAVVFGSLAHRPSSLVLLLPIGVVWLRTRERPPVVALASVGILAAVAAISTYAYVWWRTAAAPEYVLVESGIRDLSSLFVVVTARRWSGLVLARDLGWPTRALQTVQIAAHSITWPLVGAAVIGWGQAIRRRHGLLLTVWSLLVGFPILVYDIVDRFVLLVALLPVLALFIGVAVDRITARFDAWDRWPVRAGVVTAIGGLLLLHSGPEIEARVVDVSGAWVRSVVTDAPPGSTVVTTDYHTAMFGQYETLAGRHHALRRSVTFDISQPDDFETRLRDVAERGQIACALLSEEELGGVLAWVEDTLPTMHGRYPAPQPSPDVLAPPVAPRTMVLRCR